MFSSLFGGSVMRNALLVLGLLLLVCPSNLRAEEGKTYEVEVQKDVAYYNGEGLNKERHALDLYLPKGARDYPVLFFIHGGGWTKGTKSSFARHGEMFAKQGIGCVSTNYRLSPDVKHPEHIKDVARAFAWTHENLKKHGANVDRIFVSGHSAGGHLAALLATDESYLKEHKLSLKDIKGVIPVSGVFVVRAGQAFDADGARGASPQTHIREQLPPMLLLYGEKEQGALGKQAEAFAAALKKAKVDAKVEMIKDRDHGSIMRNIASADDPATKLIVAFIRKHGETK